MAGGAGVEPGESNTTFPPSPPAWLEETVVFLVKHSMNILWFEAT